MTHSAQEVVYFVAVTLPAMLLNKQRRKLLPLLHNFPLETALQAILQRMVGNGVQSPPKANGSESIQGRQEVPAEVLCWFARRDWAAADVPPLLLRVTRVPHLLLPSQKRSLGVTYAGKCRHSSCAERKSALLPAVLMALCWSGLEIGFFSASYFQECLPARPCRWLRTMCSTRVSCASELWRQLLCRAPSFPRAHGASVPTTLERLSAWSTGTRFRSYRLYS